MKLLDDYKDLQKQIFKYFGYEEGWTSYPIDDSTDQYWSLNIEEGGGGNVWFGEEEFEYGEESTYSNEILTTRHLPKWVYRGKDFTMIVVDTQCDGNKFLQIFDNKKEVVDEEC